MSKKHDNLIGFMTNRPVQGGHEVSELLARMGAEGKGKIAPTESEEDFWPTLEMAQEMADVSEAHYLRAIEGLQAVRTENND